MYGVLIDPAMFCLQCLTKQGPDSGQYPELCRESLRWVRHLMPFCKLLSGGAEALGSVLLTLLTERGAGQAGAQLLAQYFRHPEDEELDPVLRDRLQDLLKDWQR